MIRELKTFVAVAREGTFTAGGEKVGLTQAAVSAQMQRLEAELGFQLFDRTGRSARLNAMGQQTLARARDLLSLYGSLGSRSVEESTTGLLNIGAIASVQRSLLSDALAKFHKQFRGFRTRVVPGLSMQLLDLVDAGNLDMAVIIRPPFSLQSDLRWTLLAREPYRLLVPQGLAEHDWNQLLSNQPFIRYDRASFGGRQVDRFLRSARLEVKEVCELDELDAIVALVARGLGVALVPETGTQRHWPAATRAIDLQQHTFHRDIGLVRHASRSLSDPASLLVRLLCSTQGAVGARRHDEADSASEATFG